jgi:hypothetical protein
VAREAYDLACIYTLAGKPQQALALLRKSQASGYFQSPLTLARLQKEPALASLRTREDFRSLMSEVSKAKK